MTMPRPKDEDVTIGELDLDVRTRNALRNAEVLTLAQVRALTPEWIRRIFGSTRVGRSTRNILAAIEEFEARAFHPAPFDRSQLHGHITGIINDRLLVDLGVDDGRVYAAVDEILDVVFGTAEAKKNPAGGKTGGAEGRVENR
jgi:hypothetical protein